MVWSRTRIAAVAVVGFLLAGGSAIVSVHLLGKFLHQQARASSAGSLDAVLARVTPGPGGIQKAVPGWKELAWGKVDGEHDPAAPPGQPGCYGIAWGVEGYNKTVLVFQSKQNLTFRTGGWYVQVQVPDKVSLSPEDLGRIQAEWLDKTYATGPLQVQVLK